MKYINLLVTLTIILLFVVCCNQKSKELKIDLKSQNLVNLTKLAYEYRNDSIFPEICQLLNDSILIKNKSFFMFPIFINEVIDVDLNKHDTIIGFSGFYSYIYNEFRNDAATFYVLIDNDSIFIDHSFYDISDIKQLAEDFISRAHKEYGDYAKDKYKSKYFGETEVSIVNIVVILTIGNSSTIIGWKLCFDCLHELFSIFEDEQNNIALQKWNKPFNSLSNAEKIGILEVAPYRICLNLKR
ncbi:MAG: hypothetical protein LBL13_05495 [Bacteroidales bacterium]|jgi:hypothetical protein|nr:hypothetical protein [Bacteroidales bacterium]